MHKLLLNRFCLQQYEEDVDPFLVFRLAFDEVADVVGKIHGD
jgi:hypothetical protein